MFLFNPFKNFINLYKQILSLSNASKTLFLFSSGLIVGWWLYVPVHELLHAAGCLISGGEVHRLEIKALYGGTILSEIFPFVISGGDYAGRLSGFDTLGSDWVYAVTVFFPFILSLFGFFFLELATRKKARFAFAFILPWAFAPLISLTGDFFELGTLTLFQVWPGPSEINRLLISDDIFRLLKDMSTGALSVPLVASSISFILISLFIGAIFAWGILIISDTFRGLVARYMHWETLV